MSQRELHVSHMSSMRSTPQKKTHTLTHTHGNEGGKKAHTKMLMHMEIAKTKPKKKTKRRGVVGWFLFVCDGRLRLLCAYLSKRHGRENGKLQVKEIAFAVAVRAGHGSNVRHVGVEVAALRARVRVLKQVTSARSSWALTIAGR